MARKQRFLAIQARLNQQKYLLKRFIHNPILSVQIDEMETHEHTKLKPLSIALAVHGKTREILGYQISQMPARGPQTEISVRKYGKRADHRAIGMNSLFADLLPYLDPKAEIVSDCNPKYPKWFGVDSLGLRHRKEKGRRGCVVGGGELKKIGFDPLFSFNHTAAMLRAKVSRLFRRTWNTTKKVEGLSQHIAIYIDCHNQRIVQKSGA